MALVKSGWLWRQSSFLRRWKKRWFDLWMNGVLVYYSDDSRRTLKDMIFLRFNCTDVKAGQECQDVQPPEGKSRDCLLTIFLRNNFDVMLCAESEDDAIAWKTALLQQKSNLVYLYNPYDGLYHTMPLQAHHGAYIHPGQYYNAYQRVPGMTNVIVREYPHRMLRNQMPLGMLAGALTGAALGSFLWFPCWF
ncbi:pleckstrin homology domain-containing family B member 1 [Microcaecilia unicolor]|uniref:Pleckstrin homology domain-containing family B member 1 n=1 Tax=Microcaecilia unicolor TaxID=1415580 RepID=A0A6P7XPW1_9AMPH|nr:pleckstrin homology domain-containing family B member 1 [Microcaecilia unicolor]XP_030055186.1 pleckstrin homology domain-containing family B member 1 [Microcaecilia unicolor]